MKFPSKHSDFVFHLIYLHNLLVINFKLFRAKLRKYRNRITHWPEDRDVQIEMLVVHDIHDYAIDDALEVSHIHHHPRHGVNRSSHCHLNWKENVKSVIELLKFESFIMKLGGNKYKIETSMKNDVIWEIWDVIFLRNKSWKIGWNGNGDIGSVWAMKQVQPFLTLKKINA